MSDLVSNESVQPGPDKSLEIRRKEQFAQVNASLALEGLQVDAGDLAIQEAVSSGRLSHDEAVGLYLERAGKVAK